MPSYLVETFLARGAADERARRDRAASDAAEAQTRAGTRVRFGGSIYVPEDEVCFLRFEAKSDRDVTLVVSFDARPPMGPVLSRLPRYACVVATDREDGARIGAMPSTRREHERGCSCRDNERPGD